MKEFMYYVNGLYFANLKTARKHAQRVGDSDILLTLGDYDETILAYHPMSERLNDSGAERLRGKIRLNDFVDVNTKIKKKHLND